MLLTNAVTVTGESVHDSDPLLTSTKHSEHRRYCRSALMTCEHELISTNTHYSINDHFTTDHVSLPGHRLFLQRFYFCFRFFRFQFSKSFSSSVIFSSLLLSTPIYPIIGLFLGESASLSSFFSVFLFLKL